MLGQLETLRSQVSHELAAMIEYPRLDPTRVLRIYKKLNISSIAALKEKLESGEIAGKFGARMDQHVRQALTETHEILLYQAEDVASSVETFLFDKCGASRTEVTGDYRRRVEVLSEISFLIETDNFAGVVSKMERYGGKTELLDAGDSSALFKLSAGPTLKIETANKDKWGIALILSTGSESH